MDDEKGNFLCAIKKDRNVLYVSKKVQRSSASLLQLFCAINAIAVSLGSNAHQTAGVKSQKYP